jgi:CPA2 family monovalent cation:H+ antiporter-2
MFAAGEAPDFLVPVATIVVTAAAVAWVCQRVGLVPIVGFLVAGVAIGPNALGLVGAEDTVEAAADIGVILLLFVIGIEFNLERLARERRMLIGGGSATIVGAAGVTVALVMPFGVDATSAVYTGLLVSVSSTAVVLSLLAMRHQTTSEAGRASVAILIFEDLAVIGMVLVIPMLGTEGGSALDVVGAIATAAVVIAAVVFGARRIMPPVLEAVARVCSTEVFLLAVLAICIGVGYVTQLAGVGVSLGAFLAGLAVSESRFSAHALGEILPLQIVFTATFFISVGMLLDPSFLFDEAGIVAAAVAFVLVVKAVTGATAAVLFGVAVPVAIGSAVLRAQIGEFSFVLEAAGRDAGLSPLGIDERGVQLFLATSVVLMIITPVISPITDRVIATRWNPRRAATAPAAAPTDGHAADGHGVDLRDHVIVAGYGRAAAELVAALRIRDVPFVVTSLDPAAGDTLARSQVPVLQGDATKPHLLERAGIRRAKVVVVADDEPELTARIASLAAELNADLRIVALAGHHHEIGELAAAGVTDVVAADRASHLQLAATVSHLAGTDRTRRAGEVVAFQHDPGVPCGHLTAIAPVAARTDGCEECLALGQRWVHLRICLTCGHVGCCDDSPGRHARAHATTTPHAVAASFEPDESWAWCYVDELDISTRTSAAGRVDERAEPADPPPSPV